MAPKFYSASLFNDEKGEEVELTITNPDPNDGSLIISLPDGTYVRIFRSTKPGTTTLPKIRPS